MGIDLGEMTVAYAWRENLAALIAEKASLSLRAVNRRLNRAHGRTLLRNLFEELEAGSAGSQAIPGTATVAYARKEDLVDAIAEQTGLSIRSVVRRLNDAHGKTYLQTIFPEFARDDTDEDFVEGSEGGGLGIDDDVEIAGDMTVAQARDRGIEDAIAEFTGLSRNTVIRRLNEYHGKTLLRNAFGDLDDETDEAGATIHGEITVSQAHDQDFAAAIADETGLSLRAVRRRLNNAHGNTLLRSIFDELASDEDSEKIDAVDGEKTVAEARNEELFDQIAVTVGLKPSTVAKRLKDAHGNARLQTVFAKRWPGNPLVPLVVNNTESGFKPIIKKGRGEKMSPARTRIFVSYSHADRRVLSRLQVHLKDLSREQRIDLWDDTRLRAGDEWRIEIAEAIDSAKIAILLVSADFLASEFITTQELPALLEAAEKKGLKVIPIIVSACQFEETPSLVRYQALNPPSKPILGISYRKREELYLKLARRITELLG